MKIAFVIFDKLTIMDFVGVYDPVRRLKTMGFRQDLAWDVCAFTAEVQDENGLRLLPDKVKPDLGGYDMLVVPGGFGTRTLKNDPEFMTWLRTAALCPLKVSVCSGAILLAAAGFLEGRRATTHPNAYAELAEYGVEVVQRRVVDEGEVITARGVTSGLDLGLYLVEKLAGAEAKAKIKQQMDYPYEMVL